MPSEAETNRRKFLTSALTVTGSALASGLRSPVAAAQQPLPHNESAGAAGKPPLSPDLSLDSLYDPSTTATSLTGEAADRLAIRRLVDAWAHCADRRLAQQQANLFVPDGSIVVYDGEPATHKPTATIKGRAEILPALAVLNTYTATTHFNGQSDIVIRGDQAVGETYCLAHQLWSENGQRKLQILSIRYYDTFVRQDHRWFFLERKLIKDWADTRLSTP